MWRGGGSERRGDEGANMRATLQNRCTTAAGKQASGRVRHRGCSCAQTPLTRPTRGGVGFSPTEGTRAPPTIPLLSWRNWSPASAARVTRYLAAGTCPAAFAAIRADGLRTSSPPLHARRLERERSLTLFNFGAWTPTGVGDREPLLTMRYVSGQSWHNDACARDLCGMAVSIDCHLPFAPCAASALFPLHAPISRHKSPIVFCPTGGARASAQRPLRGSN